MIILWKGLIMESTFELTTVYVSNIFGIVLIGVLLAGNIWRFREKGAENAFLQLILFFAFCGCIFDPIAYTADGKPGAMARVIVYGSNALLYLADMFGTFFWLLFLAEHLNARFSIVHRYILGAALRSLHFRCFLQQRLRAQIRLLVLPGNRLRFPCRQPDSLLYMQAEGRHIQVLSRLGLLYTAPYRHGHPVPLLRDFRHFGKYRRFHRRRLRHPAERARFQGQADGSL